MTIYSNDAVESDEACDGDIVAKISAVLEQTSPNPSNIPKSPTDEQMNVSCVDSGITGTISTHSDLSMISQGCSGEDDSVQRKDQHFLDRCTSADHDYCEDNPMTSSLITSAVTSSSLEEFCSHLLF
ncbi:hypothetical protein L596_002760 [Steinernema carpocapsae]|uniref:Uncharacterized protein n=1 Tax=Steinernema carpocapsae TaxID=34508 RepID=A0A4U8UR27_STECR|nr:hypothetical protein L596_002760 [Steinernema carpocapsae]